MLRHLTIFAILTLCLSYSEQVAAQPYFSGPQNPRHSHTECGHSDAEECILGAASRAISICKNSDSAVLWPFFRVNVNFSQTSSDESLDDIIESAMREAVPGLFEADERNAKKIFRTPSSSSAWFGANRGSLQQDDRNISISIPVAFGPDVLFWGLQNIEFSHMFASPGDEWDSLAKSARPLRRIKFNFSHLESAYNDGRVLFVPVYCQEYHDEIAQKNAPMKAFEGWWYLDSTLMLDSLEDFAVEYHNIQSLEVESCEKHGREGNRILYFDGDAWGYYPTPVGEHTDMQALHSSVSDGILRGAISGSSGEISEQVILFASYDVIFIAPLHGPTGEDRQMHFLKRCNGQGTLETLLEQGSPSARENVVGGSLETETVFGRFKWPPD